MVDNQTEVLSAAQFRSELATLKAEILAHAKDLTAQSKPESIFSAGFCFIVLGLILLAGGYITLSIGVHTSFTFVLIVLGMAILLFGTGTQGIGNLDSKTATAQLNAKIAGGAGVLALLIGVGMALLGPQMQRTFDLETRHIAAKLKPNTFTGSSFENYWGKFDIDGVPIHSVHSGNVFIALVPYNDTQRKSVKNVHFTLLPIAPDPSTKPKVDGEFPVLIASADSMNSGVDFPTYDITALVDTKDRDADKPVLEHASQQSLPVVSGQSPPSEVEPAAVGAH
jgi:hypothetical protein